MPRRAVRRSVSHVVRIPIRSEAEAFRLALMVAVVAGTAVLIGWATEAVIGAGAFALALAAGAITYLRAADPDRQEALRRAAHAEHRHGASPGERHVLVIANEALSGGAMRKQILGEDPEHTEVDILVPVLTSRLHYGVSDVDRELEDARVCLERSLAWAREQGIAVHGEVGDPSVSSAIEGELRDFGADEVIVVTHPGEHQTWQEREELERLRRELDVPVTQVVVGG
jgi:hypothetical protein